ncbi:MAG: hypothetical protein ABSG46_15375 [Candidatus Binataceae bacterium]|jgi:hypothetical protein
MAASSKEYSPGSKPRRQGRIMTGTARALDRRPLAPPRGTAIAGVIFALLTIVGLGLVRYVIPADPHLPGTWLTQPDRREAVRFALDLVPFAGIAFLWFIGVLRNRLGELEDQFFATVFIASGLLFVAALFVASAVTGVLTESVETGHIDSQTYYFGRGISDTLLNLFAMKMAGVFMFSTCTIGLRTAIFPRWVAFSGYACAVVLLVVIANWKWITLVFPIWMLLVSTQILLAEFRSRHTRTNRPERHRD